MWSKFQIGNIIKHKDRADEFIIVSKAPRENTFYYGVRNLKDYSIVSFKEDEIELVRKGDYYG